MRNFRMPGGDNPSDQTDPWWIAQIKGRGMTELLYGSWSIEFSDISPDALRNALPPDAHIVHRSTFTNAKKVEVAIELGGCLALLRLPGDQVWVCVAASNVDDARAQLDRIKSAFPEHRMDPDHQTVQVSFWYDSPHGPRSRYRSLEVPDWETTGANYAASTRAQLEKMMRGFEPGKGGRLLLWHGPPGTGKTFAIRTLAWEWRNWCGVHYVLDPDVLLGRSPSSLFELTSGLAEPGDGEKWSLLVLEDTGELLEPTAKRDVGQALSRLLNLADGLLGQGLRLMILVTTNEPISQLHPAVSRPGRCAADIEFTGLTLPDALEWLASRGLADIDLAGVPTLAELFATLDGRELPARKPIGFVSA